MRGLFFLFWAFMTSVSLNAQDWEFWLRTQPSSPPRYDRTPAHYPDKGKAFPFHQESHSVNLGRFLRELRNELKPASVNDDSRGPSMSEMTEIQNILLEAAIQEELSASSPVVLLENIVSETVATITVAPIGSEKVLTPGTSPASSSAPLVVHSMPADPKQRPASGSASITVPVVFPKPAFPASYSAPGESE